MTYSFLILSLLLMIPAVAVWWLRPDLRSVIGLMALVSIPFALTEPLFYPDYWEPPFLFDLGNRLGFGIEDVLFVMALAAVTSTAWPVVSGQRFQPIDGEFSRRDAALRIAAVLGICFLMVAALVVADVAMIYGAAIIMTVLGIVICLLRPDLWIPSLVGAGYTTALYTALCLLLALLVPDVFSEHWNTEEFLDLYVLGIPLEELIYACTAGFVGASFYPFVTHRRFHRNDDGQSQ